jgi:predicted acyl esterase
MQEPTSPDRSIRRRLRWQPAALRFDRARALAICSANITEWLREPFDAPPHIFNNSRERNGQEIRRRVATSRHANSQWRAANTQPPSLRAIIPWEGPADLYRDQAFHGGIFAMGFLQNWIAANIIGPDGKDVWQAGQQGWDEVPVAKGWLRVSHRELDPERSLPYRPYHAHKQRQWLNPGEVVECHVEIWPTSMVFKKGHRIRLDIQPRDGVGSSVYRHYSADYTSVPGIRCMPAATDPLS